MGIKINGVSIPVGGISWEYTESKKKGANSGSSDHAFR